MLSNSEKEYLKHCWNQFYIGIRWENLIFWSGAVVIGHLILGWVGVIIVWLMDYFSTEVSSPFIFKDELPIETYERKCSAGIENCQICHNEYDHYFNEEYEKTLKWYNKIL